jgi:hypothetical protein
LAEENMARLQEMVADYVDQGDDIALDALDELKHGEGPHDERVRNYILKCGGAVSRWDAVFRKHEKKGRQPEAGWRTEPDSRDVLPSPSWRPAAAGKTPEERWRDAERLAAEMWPKSRMPFEGETGIDGSGQRGGLVEMTEFVVATDPTPIDITTGSESVSGCEKAQPEFVAAQDEENPTGAQSGVSKRDPSHPVAQPESEAAQDEANLTGSSEGSAAPLGEVAVSDSGEKHENATNEANCNNDTITSEFKESVEVTANTSPVSGLDNVAALPRESRGEKKRSRRRERRLLRRELAKKEMDRRALEMLKRGGTATMMMIEKLVAPPAVGDRTGVSGRDPRQPSSRDPGHTSERDPSRPPGVSERDPSHPSERDPSQPSSPESGQPSARDPSHPTRDSDQPP